jgi:hypothetical protein
MTMTPRKVLLPLCLGISILCLAAGFGIAGRWIGAAIAVLTGLAWLFARKYPASWLPLACLVTSIFLAIVGILAGSPSWLMIFGSGVAIAVWDLLFLEDASGGNAPEEQTRRYERKHLQSLALALGCGLMTTFVGRLLHFQIPFIVSMLLVGLLLFGLERIWGAFSKRSDP